MTSHPPTSRGGGALIIVCFFLAILVPNLLLIGFGLFGPSPSPWLIDRAALGSFEDRALSHLGGIVETRDFSKQADASNAARRYVDRVAVSGRMKLGEEYTFTRENGKYEIVVSIDGVFVRVQGNNEAHARALFSGLPFIRENPEPNLVWLLFKDYLAEFFIGLGAYLLFLLVLFSRWSSSSMTQRPSAATAAVDEWKLRELILDLNAVDAPVSVSEQARKRLLIDWRIADARWRSVLQQHAVRVRHTMLLDFDSRTHTVRAIHTSSRLRWSRGLATLFSWAWTRSVVGYEAGAETAYGVLLTEEGWRVGEAYRYRYNRSELVQPAIGAIVHSGWTYRPVYTFFKPIGG